MKKVSLLLFIGLVSLTLALSAHSPVPAEAAVSTLIHEEAAVAEIRTALDRRSISQRTYVPSVPDIDPRREAVMGLSGIETASLLDRIYPGWKKDLPSCPCRVADINDSTFVRSSWFARRYQFNIEDFHPGAIYDYRQTATTLKTYSSPVKPNAVPIRPGQQCTYDNNGYLINHGIGAGTPDAFGPEGTSAGELLHTSWDIKPFKEIVGASASEAVNNTRGLNIYHRTWTPDLGKNNRGETCPINPRPVEEGTTTIIQTQGDLDSRDEQLSNTILNQPSQVSPEVITQFTLRPGAYHSGGYINIYEYNGQFCFAGFSRNGSQTASISEDSEQPNTYLFDVDSDSSLRIFQVDANTLHYGGAEYERYSDAQLFNQLSSEAQICLTSVEPYYEFKEPTGRQ